MTEPLKQAHGATYTLSPATNDTPVSIAGTGAGAKAAGTIILRAAGGNSADVLWGFDSAQTHLGPGEAVAIDVPQGYYVDLQSLHVSGNGTSGLTVYLNAIIIG